VNATVSGSFSRAMGAVQDAVYDLTDAGAQVLSPADPRVVDEFGDFLFVASDRVRAIRLVQSRHLSAIEASDFVWLVAPEGYVGQSGGMEIGYAVAVGTPVFCSEVPVDLTMRQYVTPMSSPRAALHAVRSNLAVRGRMPAPPDVLLDPAGVLEAAHRDLEQIGVDLARARGPVAATTHAAADRLQGRIARPLRSR
jgi:hypothetical protein